MDIENLLEYQVGDVVTLSDLQTQTDFDDESVDFLITEIREYEEDQCFYYKSYIMEAPNEDLYMLMIKRVDTESEIMVYFLDNEGDLDEMGPLIAENGEDLVDQIDITLHGETEDQDKKVIFDKKSAGTFFGVDYNDSKESEGQHTIAEFYTEDECDGNPHVFVDWIGDDESGYLEMWVGNTIEKYEVSIAQGERS